MCNHFTNNICHKQSCDVQSQRPNDILLHVGVLLQTLMLGFVFSLTVLGSDLKAYHFNTAFLTLDQARRPHAHLISESTRAW